jgi:hypothetical protein
LFIIDIPKNLPVPNLSNHATLVPDWNILHDGFFHHMFDFASIHVQDSGAILLFHADDLKIKA